MITIYLSPEIDKSILRKVLAIKAVRGFTNSGLKEAKDIIDAVVAGESKVIPVNCSFSATASFSDMLRESGFTIAPVFDKEDPTVKEIISQINKVICFANITSHYGISQSLVKMLENNFPQERN